MRKLLFYKCLNFILYLQLVALAGCAKEYSYEGDQVPDTTSFADTIQPVINIGQCNLCSTVNGFYFAKWSLKYDRFSLCGNITDAVIARDRKAFTFFGPSACSADTGLIITVYLDQAPLDMNKQNIVSNHVILQYYDNKGLSDIFTSKPTQFYLSIDTYDHATGIAQGKFHGIVISKNVSVGEIRDGKFLFKFRQ